jgi:hypothetical protein
MKVVREMMVSVLEEDLVVWLGDWLGREDRFVRNIRV